MLEIYKLDLFCTRISKPSNLENTKVKSAIITDIDMISMVEKGITCETCHAIHLHAKNMKYYDKNKELSYLKYHCVTNLYE